MLRSMAARSAAASHRGEQELEVERRVQLVGADVAGQALGVATHASPTNARSPS